MNQLVQRDRIRIIVALVALYIFWGGTYLAIRFAVESIPPMMMASVRFLTAGSLMFLFLHARGAAAPTRRQWGGAAVVGILLLVCGNGGVVLAEHWGISSGLAALGTAAVPLWISVFAGLWGRAPGRLEWAGVLVGLVGVGLLNAESGFQASLPGAVAILIGGLCWAFGSVWSARLPLPQGPIASAAQMLSAGVVFSVASLASGERLVAMPSPRSLLGLLYLIVFGAIIGYSAYGFLLRRVRPALATSYSYVNPVVAVLLGVLLANEQIGPLGMLAMTVIVAGVVLVIVARDQRPATPVLSPREGEPAITSR